MPEAQSRYVILHHCLPDGSCHWDLCLEQGHTLATWQLAAHPARLASGEIAEITARRIADHRLAYLDYQGPISGGRGHVTRVDRGSCQTDSQRSDRWRVRFRGSVMIGNYEIVSGGDSDQPWTLRRADDDQSSG